MARERVAKMRWFREMHSQHQKLVDAMKEREAAKAKEKEQEKKQEPGVAGSRTLRHRRGVGEVGAAGAHEGNGGRKEAAVGSPNEGREKNGGGGKMGEEAAAAVEGDGEDNYDDARIKAALNRAIIRSQYSDSSDDDDDEEKEENTPGPRARRHA